MKAAVYRSKGPAAEVLRIEDMPVPAAGPGEVLVRVSFSGVNPSDVKTRAGLSNPAMEFPAIVPHSDGAGRIEAVGAGVPGERVGRRVWLFNGQWRRAFGTAAEYVALPADQAIDLPDGVSPEEGASIGIPLMTAMHAVQSLGPVLQKTVLVPGAAGAVGAYVTQLAARAGARVIALVSSEEKAAYAKRLGASEALDYRQDDLAARVRELTGGRGADAIVEVDAAANARHYGELLRFGGQVVVYGSGKAGIDLPFRPMILGFVRLYFFIVYLLPPAERREVIEAMGPLLAEGALQHPPVKVYPLADIARAHAEVEAGANAKVLVAI
jgi:NADPH:quinone reductase